MEMARFPTLRGRSERQKVEHPPGISRLHTTTLGREDDEEHLQDRGSTTGFKRRKKLQQTQNK